MRERAYCRRVTTYLVYHAYISCISYPLLQFTRDTYICRHDIPWPGSSFVPRNPWPTWGTSGRWTCACPTAAPWARTPGSSLLRMHIPGGIHGWRVAQLQTMGVDSRLFIPTCANPLEEVGVLGGDRRGRSVDRDTASSLLICTKHIHHETVSIELFMLRLKVGSSCQRLLTILQGGNYNMCVVLVVSQP